ncbi:MAG: helix-turn-helix domain-containing protein, partial [Planifilum fimeticola]
LPPLHGSAINRATGPEISEEPGEDTESLQEVLARTEREYIERVYRACRGNKTETARRLGISVRNLYYKLERYGIG